MRVSLVTGANRGIGFAVAEQLARRSGTVAILCRDPDRGARARDALAAGAVADIELFVCDLASQASVRSCAEALSERFESIDVLVHNAGVTAMEHTLTEDGIELAFAVDFLSPFLLTNLLLPKLWAASGARIVTLTGIYFRKGSLDLDDLSFAHRTYDWAEANNQAQLARAVWTAELARRLEGTGVTANSVHPGAVLTEAQKDLPLWARALILTVMRPGFVKPPKGAEPVVHVALEPDLAGVTGAFFRRMRQEPWDKAEVEDPAIGKALWEAAERLSD